MQSTAISLAAAILGISLTFTGCGGGGSSGSGDEPQLPESNATAADATSDNGADAVRIVIDGPNGEEMVDAISGLLESVDLTALPQTVGCETDGNVTLDGNIQLLTGGSLSIDFDSCILNGETFDGEMAMTFDGNLLQGGPLEAEMRFPGSFSMTDINGTVFNMETNSSFQMYFDDLNDLDFSGTQIGSAQWTYGDESGRFDGLSIVYGMNGSDATECYTAGRLYINGLTEWMDIDETYDVNCDHAFVIGASGLASGSIRLIGMDGNMVDVNVTGLNAITVFDANGSTTTINVGE
jgi:hypothetical protein